MRSYYDCLGVSPTASSQEIRAAYVRMMKRHHPDLASGDRRALDFATMLNGYYAVLRDPAKRRQYDARLWTKAVSERSSPNHWRIPRVAKHKLGLISAIAAAAISFAAVGVVAERKSEVPPVGTSQSVGGTSTPIAVSMAPVPELVVSRRMAKLALTLSVRDAEHFSRECFASANRESKVSNADACVIFDVAFLYWQKTPSAVPVFPAYFADQVVSVRHREAMMLYGPAAQQRLFSLREMAYRALLSRMTAATMSVTTSAANDRALPGELRAGEKERLARASVLLWDDVEPAGNRKR